MRETYVIPKRWFHLNSIKMDSQSHSVISYSSLLYIINSTVQNFFNKTTYSRLYNI